MLLFEGSTGNGLSNWFELKSVPMYRGYSDDIFGNIPLIWLLERFKKDKLGDRFQNQPGIVSEILVPEI